MITITLTVPDADHAESIITHLMADGMMYMAMPLSLKIEDSDDPDTISQRLKFIENDLDLGSNTMYTSNERFNLIEEDIRQLKK